ncbi:uncharacterized protein LOC120353152 [Nilaparvata lugens]|uniref:uncharacterized protein LOC120353152 n=1 Tax=Nilaparvata lugens TaxID=108931 RepID=UPI00193CDE1E|nr:uncharacterized protein LOC120353152 [Nilaparvata lugens]
MLPLVDSFLRLIDNSATIMKVRAVLFISLVLCSLLSLTASRSVAVEHDTWHVTRHVAARHVENQPKPAIAEKISGADHLTPEPRSCCGLTGIAIGSAAGSMRRHVR